MSESDSKPLPKKIESKHEAMILRKKLDEQSGYSHVYLTSVYHNNIPKLQRVLKTEYFNINTTGAITLQDYLNKPRASFDEEFNDLNLEEVKDKDLEELKGTEHEIKSQSDLFNYAISVALFTSIIQIAFIITIIKEYFNEDHVIANDPELITVRILAFMTLTLKLWIELCNGRKIVMQTIYHSYMFRGGCKRLLSCVMGFIQIFTALACYFCSSELIVQTESVIQCVKDFSALIILTEIDNWIGDYFLNTNRAMEVYARNDVSIIKVIRKKDYSRYRCADLVLDIIIIVNLIVSVIPMYSSIDLTTKITPVHQATKN